jgi:hypothetical protein
MLPTIMLLNIPKTPIKTDKIATNNFLETQTKQIQMLIPTQKNVRQDKEHKLEINKNSMRAYAPNTNYIEINGKRKYFDEM